MDSRVGINDIAHLTRLKSVRSFLRSGGKRRFQRMDLSSLVYDSTPKTHLEWLLHLTFTKPTKITSL